MNKPKKSHKKSSSQGSIRIISGKYRGRKLPVLDAEGLRPTTDRVKETVFNWLMPYIQDSICLDCFAGSGGLGFEALSRGAQKVTFVELHKTSAAQIQKNIQQINATNADVITSDALTFLSTTAHPFDLVFIDPPFHQDIINKTLSALEQGWLSEDALIYIERESEQSGLNIPTNWILLKEKKAGQVIYALYQSTII